jgi:hypothetical protein
MDNCDSNTAVEPRRRGWLGRNWKWFVPVFVLLLFVLCAGVAVALFFKFVGQGELLEIYRADGVIKASEPFRMAIEQLEADGEVVKRLGEPAEAVGYASGSVIESSDDDNGGGESTGNANFYFELAGPKGAADVACQGKMVDGKWGLSVLKVTFDDGTRHSVEISGGDDGLEEAPAWSP